MDYKTKQIAIDASLVKLAIWVRILSTVETIFRCNDDMLGT